MRDSATGALTLAKQWQVKERLRESARDGLPANILAGRLKLLELLTPVMHDTTVEIRVGGDQVKATLVAGVPVPPELLSANA